MPSFNNPNEDIVTIGNIARRAKPLNHQIDNMDFAMDISAVTHKRVIDRTFDEFKDTLANLLALLSTANGLSSSQL